MDFNMEFIIYTALTILAWTLSLSWLLPLVTILKFSKTCRNKWFSWIFVKVVGPLLNHAMTKMRKQAFNRLKDHLGDRKRKAPLEILEIGIGGGANLQFYPENSNLTVVDMNPSFLTYFEEMRQKHPQVTLKKAVITMAEDMHEIDDDSFDVVICTYTLCSVVSVRSVLDEVKRVLKPGGKFLCVEHILYPSSSWNSMLQKFANALWTIYFNGCTLTRKTDEEIRKTGFTDVAIDKHHPKDMWLVVRSQIIGIATK
ncbi:Methyltransferase-like protein 7A [Araneus ventricosus]|uniref:Methyltransferase-like protein 7A n=1 Tax=Araneus ventricosus TaxID=182803 RepID=A0A4Y2L6K4_ARAVE|nr:Methyltransferase-like protein 7A [Araneus ventricosus]